MKEVLRGAYSTHALAIWRRFSMHSTPLGRPGGLIDIVYEDNHVLVVSKPAGLLTQPDGSQRDSQSVLELGRLYIQRRYEKPGRAFLGLVHRLDLNTSGIVVLARTSKAARRLSECFKPSGTAEKRYACLVHGSVMSPGSLVHAIRYEEGWVRSVRTPAEAEIKAYRDTLTEKYKDKSGYSGIADLIAHLSYRPLMHFEVPLNAAVNLSSSEAGAVRGRGAPLPSTRVMSLLDVQLHSGRKHQIRVQMAAAGHPIVGDILYGGGSHGKEKKRQMSSHVDGHSGIYREPVSFLGLHNYFLSFPHPVASHISSSPLCTQSASATVSSTSSSAVSSSLSSLLHGHSSQPYDCPPSHPSRTMTFTASLPMDTWADTLKILGARPASLHDTHTEQRCTRGSGCPASSNGHHVDAASILQLDMLCSRLEAFR